MDLVRLYEFLAQYDLGTAERAVDTIIASLDMLEKLPQACPLITGRIDIRKLVINFGATGCLASYGYDPLTDASTVVSILRQKE